MKISWNEIQREPDRWVIIYLGDRVECRERPKYGNRHAVFQWSSIYGWVHYDEHNALDFPDGTIKHFAKWGNEKTGIDEGALRALGWGALIVLAIKAISKL